MKPLLTPWGEQIDRNCPLNDYPRPQMVRKQWQCLNGLWEYVMHGGDAPPETWDGEILVPFSPESLLSGVNRQLLPGMFLRYRRMVRFEMPNDDERLLLHFGAVDQHCIVYCNGEEAGRHSGGYWPFYFDITHLVQNGENELQVLVWDDTDTGDEAYGKQKLKRGGIWYTGQSGIWQTVWCEIVPKRFIRDIKITPLYNEGAVEIVLMPSTPRLMEATAKVFDGDVQVAEGEFAQNTARLMIPSFKSWSPESPFLYGLRITMGDDTVVSYFGMRDFGIMMSKHGAPCFALNNKPIFQSGLLDQGYWSDGLYTPPSDKAMIWELAQVKACGFNMLRKHIKIEPLRWYYHCDRLGILVWQDYVNGGQPYHPMITQYAPWIGLHFSDSRYARFGRKRREGRDVFLRDGARTMNLLRNVVSLAVWVPFNEGWGQFDAKRVTDEIRKADPTRLIDHASGWHDQGAGDFQSRHIYYKRFRYKKDEHGRIPALTEFGGYSFAEKGHTSSDSLFGYKIFKAREEMKDALLALFRRDVLKYIPQGLSVSIYTQVSDVEDEINGIFTYDRKKMKCGAAFLRGINEMLYQAFYYKRRL